MLTRCPECQGPLSTQARSCPRCGHPAGEDGWTSIAETPTAPPPAPIPARQKLPQAAPRAPMSVKRNPYAFWLPMAVAFVVMLICLLVVVVAMRRKRPAAPMAAAPSAPPSSVPAPPEAEPPLAPDPEPARKIAPDRPAKPPPPAARPKPPEPPDPVTPEETAAASVLKLRQGTFLAGLVSRKGDDYEVFTDGIRLTIKAEDVLHWFRTSVEMAADAEQALAQAKDLYERARVSSDARQARALLLEAHHQCELARDGFTATRHHFSSGPDAWLDGRVSTGTALLRLVRDGLGAHAPKEPSTKPPAASGEEKKDVPQAKWIIHLTGARKVSALSYEKKDGKVTIELLRGGKAAFPTEEVERIEEVPPSKP